MTQKMLILIEDLKTKYDVQEQWLWCNNAGENQAFEWACNEEGLGIEFEYISPGTPQQNGHVKHKFATFLKLSSCYAQQWENYYLPAKQSLGRRGKYYHVPQESPNYY